MRLRYQIVNLNHLLHPYHKLLFVTRFVVLQFCFFNFEKEDKCVIFYHIQLKLARNLNTKILLILFSSRFIKIAYSTKIRHELYLAQQGLTFLIAI